MTPNTTPSRWLAPAPSVASASAKQFASFSNVTRAPSAAARSRRNGRPLKHVVFEFFTRPSGVIPPGIDTPTGVEARSSAPSAATPRTRSTALASTAS